MAMAVWYRLLLAAYSKRAVLQAFLVCLNHGPSNMGISNTHRQRFDHWEGQAMWCCLSQDASHELLDTSHAKGKTHSPVLCTNKMTFYFYAKSHILSFAGKSQPMVLSISNMLES